jgi:hypothetical protein
VAYARFISRLLVSGQLAVFGLMITLMIMLTLTQDLIVGDVWKGVFVPPGALRLVGIPIFF